MAISEALNAGAVYSEMILRMDKFDDAMRTLQGALHKIDADVAKTKKGFNFSGLSSSLDAVGKKMSMAFTLPFAVTGFAAVGSAISDSVKNASDLNETVSKTNVIFGTASKDISKWSDTADQKMGMSKRAAMDAASSFALFGKQAGLSGQAVSDFSKQNVQMAADLASFFNSSPEEAITAISAALRGESEPIRRYNVLLDDASLRQEAMKKGIISTTKDALTPQQRILAAQSLIMQQASAASGDFARTSDQLANQQRIQAAAYENATAKLGTALLPAMLAFKSTMVDVLTWVNNLSEGQKKAIVYIGAFAVAIGPALVVVAKLITGISAAMAVFTGFRAAIMGTTLATNASRAAQVSYTLATKSAAAAQIALNIAMKANPIGLIIGAIVAAAVAVASYAASCDEAREKEEKLKAIREQRAAADRGDIELSDEVIKRNKTLAASYDKIKDNGQRVAKVLEHIQELELARKSSAADEDTEKRINEDMSYWQQYKSNIQSAMQAASDKRDSDKQKWEAYMRARQTALLKYSDMENQLENNELITEGARYQKDLAELDNYLAEGTIKTSEALEKRLIIQAAHDKNVSAISEKSAQEYTKVWKSALDIQSSDFMSKLESIKSLNSDFVSDSKKTAMTFAAAFSSALSAVGNIISSIFSYQQQMIEKQYSHATEAETAYQAYQDQQDAKSYAKMSAKEKKEYNLKKAADKAKEEQEAKKNKKLEQLQKEQTAFTLVQSIAQIGISTAMAIMAIWSKLWMTEPEKIGWTAFVAALGATEMAAAAIAAAPAMATGGLVRSRSGGSQIVAGEAGYDEWVVPDTDKVMNGIASRLNRMQNKQGGASSATDEATSGTSLGERLVARVTAPFNVDGISFGNAIIDVFDKGYAHIGQNRVVPA